MMYESFFFFFSCKTPLFNMEVSVKLLLSRIPSSGDLRFDVSSFKSGNEMWGLGINKQRLRAGSGPNKPDN